MEDIVVDDILAGLSFADQMDLPEVLADSVATKKAIILASRASGFISFHHSLVFSALPASTISSPIFALPSSLFEPYQEPYLDHDLSRTDLMSFPAALMPVSAGQQDRHCAWPAIRHLAELLRGRACAILIV